MYITFCTTSPEVATLTVFLFIAEHTIFTFYAGAAKLFLLS